MIKVDKARLDGSIGLLTETFNNGVLNQFVDLAAVLKQEKEDASNEIVEQTFEQCKRVQVQYNTCIESLKGFFKDVEGVIEIGDYLEKMADMGSVKEHDTSFACAGIDPSSVRM